MGLVPGTRLGQYEITGPLGAGGMGEVYRATDTKLGRDVALKLLPEAFAADPDRLARFEREAKVLASPTTPASRTCTASIARASREGRRSTTLPWSSSKAGTSPTA